MTPRVVAAAAGLALGATGGVVLAFVHADRVHLGSVTIDFGVLLAAATALASTSGEGR